MNWHNIHSYLITHWPTILFYGVFSIAIPVFVTWLAIRFGPDRKEVSRLSKAIDKMAVDQEKQKRAERFRCEVTFQDKTLEGARLTFKSDSPFRLLQIEMANENGAPVATVNVDSDIANEQACVMPLSAINSAYWSTAGGNTKQGVVLYSVEVDGVVLERKRGVLLNQSMCTKPGDTSQVCYVTMS